MIDVIAATQDGSLGDNPTRISDWAPPTTTQGVEQANPPPGNCPAAVQTATLVEECSSVDEADLSQDKLPQEDGDTGDGVSSGPEDLQQPAESLADAAPAQIEAEAEVSDTTQRADPDEANSPIVKSNAILAKTAPEDIQRAEELLRDPNLLSIICSHVHQLGVAGEDDLITMVYLIGTSRLLARPLAGLITSASSTGKSYVANAVAKLFPEEVVLMAHRLTPKALEKMVRFSLKHRFVVCGERSHLRGGAAAESTRAFREMISDGKLTVGTQVSDGAGGRVTRIIVQPGPISYFEGTTQNPGQILDEDRNRFLILSGDESSEQTQAVIAANAQRAAEPPDQGELEGIIALHHTMQRLLLSLQIVIPFATKVDRFFPSDRIETRRVYGQFLSLVQAVALLHQHQRERDDHGRLIASEDDYEVVRTRFLEPLGRSLGQSLTAGALQVLQKLQGRTEPFTARDVVAATRLGPTTVGNRLNELLDAGQIEVIEQWAGPRPYKYILPTTPPPLHGLELPPLQEVEAAASCL